jgi:hypothetical protein
MLTLLNKKDMTAVRYLVSNVILLLIPMVFLSASCDNGQYFSDKAGAVEMFEKAQISLSKVKNILCDGGYIGKSFCG